MSLMRASIADSSSVCARLYSRINTSRMKAVKMLKQQYFQMKMNYTSFMLEYTFVINDLDNSIMLTHFQRKKE